jgi:hypothetical protein
VKIEFYIPAKYDDGKEIPELERKKLIYKIQSKYKGSTTFQGAGYFSDESGEENADTYILSVVTRGNKSTLEGDLKAFKEDIKNDLRQKVVLITYHDVIEVR